MTIAHDKLELNMHNIQHVSTLLEGDRIEMESAALSEPAELLK